ncbi:MAG: hypothetical protein JW708_10690, partial [Vallitaleaceae bacterium]|nr:hypothetical protein [Vallitaleaceae bacterium]
MKKFNIPLIIGAIILSGLLIIMIFPDFFATQNPYTISHMRFIHTEAELDVERAPFAPDRDYLLGSDHLGRDIYSYILFGTRMTISMAFLIALSEFLLAVPLALLAGFGKKSIAILIEKFNILFSAIPAVLIAVIVLNLDYFAGQDKT